MVFTNFLSHANGLRIHARETDAKPFISVWDFALEEGELNATDLSQDSLQLEMDPDYYLHHVRKAGGSTMRRWMNDLCMEKGYETRYQPHSNDHSDPCAVITEGGSITKQGHDQLFGVKSEFKVSLIHLRHPVARAQSLVNMNLHQHMKQCEESKGCNQRHGPTIEKEISAASCGSQPESSPIGHQIPMWNCIDNMYVKSLVGTNSMSSHGQWTNITEDDFNIAKQRLSEFSAVLITEWFEFPNTAEYLSKDIFHLDHTIPLKHFNTAKQHYDKQYTFNKEQWAQIEASNYFDVKIYEYAKELAFKRMKDAGYAMSADLLSK